MASNIPQERWYASIIGFLGTKSFKQWQHLDISKKDEEKKHPENMFKAFVDTLEVSISHWNHINEMYSDIRQGKQETTNQLDQHIKILVKRCSYTTEWEEQCQLELLFHAMKHFKVKKWVRSQTALNETVTFDKLLQHAKQHEATIKDFHQHKSNRGVAMATTIDEIRTFKYRKGQGQRAKSNQGKICGKCGTSHPPRECPAWGKKCHKCDNKNHFSTQCRSKQSGAGNRKSHSTSRGCKGRGKPHCSRSRRKLATKSAYSSQPPFKTIQMTSMEETLMTSMEKEETSMEIKEETSMEKVQTSMEIREKTSMEPIPFKTIRKVLIFLNNHFLPFLGQNQWPA